MACFLVSAAEAVAVTVAARALEKKEAAQPAVAANEAGPPAETAQRTPFYKKLKWLRNMLWGGSLLLAFEHVWHGEVVPWFPFLTAASNPQDAAEMLHEMATVGVAMAALVTLAWVGMVVVTARLEKRAQAEAMQKNEGGVSA